MNEYNGVDCVGVGEWLSARLFVVYGRELRLLPSAALAAILNTTCGWYKILCSYLTVNVVHEIHGQN